MKVNSVKSGINPVIQDQRGTLQGKVVEVIVDTARDQKTKKAYKENLNLLNAGVFYGQEYFLALKEMGQQPRLDFFRKKDSFLFGYLSAKYFKTAIENQQQSFVIQPQVKPSVALHSIRQGLSILGCGEVVQLAQYEAILSAIGEEKFDALFAAETTTPLTLGPINSNPIGKLRLYFLQENLNPEDLQLGDHIYISNVPEYTNKHPIGENRGFNAVCIKAKDDSPALFSGHGLSDSGETLEEINHRLLAAYNELPVSATIELCTEKTARTIPHSNCPTYTITQEEYIAKKGGNLTLISAIDEQKIAALAESASLSQARSLLDEFKVTEQKR